MKEPKGVSQPSNSVPDCSAQGILTEGSLSEAALADEDATLAVLTVLDLARNCVIRGQRASAGHVSAAEAEHATHALRQLPWRLAGQP